MPLLVRGSRPGKPVHLEEYEIKFLCLKARDIFINQPILLELEAPIKICGTWRPVVVVSKEWRSLLTCVSSLIRWYPWSILWPLTTFWIRRFSTGSQLFILGWLCRQRKAILGNNLPIARLQDQVSRKLLYPARQSRVCFHQSNLWVLRWVQEAIQYQALEDIYRLLQLSSHCCHHWREDFYNAWRIVARLAKYGANQTSDEANRCSRYWWVLLLRHIQGRISGSNPLFLTLSLVRSSLRSSLVRSRQGHLWMVREWSRSILYLWSRCRVPILAKARYGLDLQSASSRWRWIRILCKTTIGYIVFGTKLLWGIWQCRCNDECRRNALVLFSNSETSRKEAKVRIWRH